MKNEPVQLMRERFVLGVGTCLCAIACSSAGIDDGNELVATVSAPGVCATSTAAPASNIWLANLAEDDVFHSTSVATDEANNVLLARSAGELRKLAPDGSALWSRPFGSLVATDRTGNAYVAGASAAGLPLGAGTVDLQDTFVAKLDPSGHLLADSRLPNAPGGLLGLAVGADGSVVVSGKGLGTVKLDGAGHPLWSRSFEGSLAIDSKSNVWMTGAFTDSVDFGGGLLVSAGGEDIFVVELDADGNHVWSRRFGDAGTQQRGEAIAIDPEGNVLVSGVVDGVVDFGGGPIGVQPGTCPKEIWCEQAGFALKLDPLGNFLWSWSRAPIRSLPGIAGDSRGNVLVSGAYPGDVEPYRLSFLIELDPAGAQRWQVLERPMTGLGTGHRVTVDSCDDVIWSTSVRPSLDQSEHSYLAKLTP